MPDRQTLSAPPFGDALDDFAPRGGAGEAAAPRASETSRANDAVSRFPTREPSSDGQLNLKGPQHVLDRFRAMCKADRRAYSDMLEIVMDRFEDPGRG